MTDDLATRIEGAMTNDTEALVEKLARAICCGAGVRGGCAAQFDGSEFTTCQAHTYRRDAETCLPIIEADRTRYGKERWNAGVEAGFDLAADLADVWDQSGDSGKHIRRRKQAAIRLRNLKEPE